MKKVLSFTLALCLLVSICTPASAAKVDSMTDVPSGQWFYEAVSYCLEHSYMDGIGGGKFDPRGTVNRAQIAQVLYNKAGKPSTQGLANPFTDVGEQWYKDAIVWCKANNVVNGTSTTTFTPTKPVSREQVCTMFFNFYKDYLAKTTELAEVSDMGKYTDWGKVSTWAQDAVRWAVKSGFMKGKSSTTLDPKGQATRAELAQFLVNFDKVLENDKPVEPEKCEHGNDPATCPICNAEKPSGLYNPNPSNKVIDSVLSTTYYDGNSPEVVFNTCNNYMKTDEARNTFINDPGHVSYESLVYMVDDPDYGLSYDNSAMAILTQGANHTNNVKMKSVPSGGTTNGGKVYNKYGQDVSSVDGKMTDFEANIYRALNFTEYALNDNYYGDQNHQSAPYFKESVQAAAEDRLVQVLENIENYAKAGSPCSAGETHYTSSLWNRTIDAAIIGLEPTWTRRLVELAKNYSNENDLYQALYNELAMDQWGTTQLGNTITINWETGAWNTIRDWVDDSTKNGQTVLGRTLYTQEIVVHLDESVRNSYGISPTDIACAAYAMLGGYDAILGGADDFQHPATGVAYDPATSTCVILTAEWALY